MSTKYDAEAIKAAAGKLGSIMDDMAPFTALKAAVPNAGSFDLAMWLERVLQARRNDVVAHAEHLKVAFEDMRTTLTTIATDFENADGDNAKKIGASIDDLQAYIADDISRFDDGAAI